MSKINHMIIISILVGFTNKNVLAFIVYIIILYVAQNFLSVIAIYSVNLKKIT